MSEPLRVLLVDDEPLARRRLRRLLAAESNVEIVGECGNGADAVAAMRHHTPDLVLLDVQMPAGDGFEVAAQVGPAALPLIVFVTAYDEYALRAFEAAALDYLLKPVRRPRLRSALGRAREQLALHAAARAHSAAGEVVESPQTSPAASTPAAERLLIDRGHHMDVARVDDIDWIEAADNYVIVHIRGECHRFRRTMEQLLERLPADRFARIHRSAIVNLERVRQVHQWFHGGYLLVLADGTKLTTGRQYQAKLMERLHLLR
jgi:two-component system, LytTR family, response regulator